MKPSLVCLCHRQTSSPPENTHTHTHTHLGKISLWLFSSSAFPSSECAREPIEWQEFCLHLPLPFVLSLYVSALGFLDSFFAFLPGWTALESGCEVKGKSCLSSVAFSSAQTDARACVNDSLSPRTSAGCRAACYSLQVKCLWRHMEQGKLTTRGNSPEQREAR